MKALEIISLVLDLICSVLSIITISMILNTWKADAEAEANKKIADSLTEEYLEYNYVNAYANAWNGELPLTYVGSDTGSIPVINTKAAEMVGE